MNKITLIALATLMTQAYAKEKIIYGDDNRVEPHQATSMQQRLSLSTAGMIPSVKVVESGDYALLPPATITNDMGLCQDEKFSNQPSAVICSGFLVAPDILVTAGHCIPTQESCEEMSWVFDYKIKEKTNRADVMVPKSKVFKCSKVIGARLEMLDSGDKKDYAVVKLDRPVTDRAPLQYRTKGDIKSGDGIFVIGHPSGLPTKVAGDASVFTNSMPGYFETNLDTFGGNSGSAVFNASTGTIEGILVRGAKDYIGDGNCARVNQVEQDITGKATLGESVSRITDVPALQGLAKFIQAAKSGDLAAVKSLGAELGDLNLTDGEYNTALHIAIENGHNDIAGYLIANGANINHQNLAGETPLHRAAFVNNKNGIAKLVHAGADILIQDNFGVYASERTNYLAFGIRKMLRRAQQKEITKRAKNL